MLRRILLYFFAVLLLPAAAVAQSDTLATVLANYFHHYKAPSYSPTGRCKLLTYEVNDESRTIDINANDVFGAQPLTPGIVTSIYASVSRCLPAPYNGYKLNISSEGKPLSSLIPNPYLDSPHADRRWGKRDYHGQPWVYNASRPYVYSMGLQNRHLSIWASHGRYYSQRDGRWMWQRPYLFCTTEDLFTQSFVVPFLIPMLENAGAIVYSPRERAWQKEEVIVDNDSPALNGIYHERQGSLAWQRSGSTGFALRAGVLHDDENPFTFGSSRMVGTVRSAAGTSLATWIPKIPRAGRYAVYVSYPTIAGAVEDARYTVHHGGQSTTFHVNQTMGAGTWVYLGTFYFEAGQSDRNCVSLSNQSRSKGFVGADAVRFGGGMGDIVRGAATADGGENVSRLPRYLEGARYAVQYYGFPYSVYSSYSGTDDYKDDINARSYATNYLAGGSVYLPNAEGKKVPMEMALAVHSDAGYSAGNFVGTLGIATTNGQAGETTYPTGLSRKASYDLASLITDGVATEMAAIYHMPWSRREIYDKNYSESSRPEMPASIVEMMSHQNFRDMVYGHDPIFKFHMARSIYKGILRFLSFEHGKHYTVAPLPPDNFSVEFSGNREVTLRWRAVKDSLESTATPTGYIVYMRKGSGDFDNGTFVRHTNMNVTLTPGVLYSFKVTAVNRGGESFPTEVLAACRAATQAKPILIVNGFTRLSGPAIVDNADSLGFDIYKDIGVPYIETPEYSGAQKSFNPLRGGDNSAEGLGRSGYELADAMIAGNTFDYVALHGRSLMQKYSFASSSRQAVENGSVSLAKYAMVDLIMGLQKRSRYDFRNFKTFSSALRSRIGEYLAGGGSLLCSGAYIGRDMSSGAADRNFLSQQLHVAPSGEIRSTGAISGLGVSFEIEQQLGRSTYAVQSADRLRPQSGGKSILSYADGTTSGVLYDGPHSRCITLGFPIESIRSESIRSRLMNKFAEFLMTRN